MIISYLVVKKKFHGKFFIEFVSMLAMAVPGTVLGVGYIRGFAGGMFRTGFLQGIYGTGLILIIVFVVRSLPVGTRSGISALRQIDKSIEESAYDLGAGSGKVFTRDAAADQGFLLQRPGDHLRALHHRHQRGDPAGDAAVPADHLPHQRIRRKGRIWRRLRVRDDPDHDHLRGDRGNELRHQPLRHEQKDQRKGGLIWQTAKNSPKGVELEHISKIYKDPKTGKDFYAVHNVDTWTSRRAAS